MVTALNNGCKKVIPVREVEEAMNLAEQDKENNLLGGERDGIKLEGFHFSNSPLDYTKEAVEGKILIMTTTNGTRAIKNSESADMILIAAMSLSDIAITAEYIYKANPDIHSFVKEASHYKRMEQLSYNEDLKYCFTKDTVDIVPVYKDGELKIIN